MLRAFDAHRRAIDGQAFDCALMTQGDGTHRLLVKRRCGTAIGKEAGDPVHLRIDERVRLAGPCACNICRCI